MERIRLFSINISRGTFEEAKNRILSLGTNRISSYICFTNVHMCIEAYKDVSFADVVNGADFVASDGMPIAKGINFLYGITQEKISGPDLMPAILQAASLTNLRVFFYGSTETVLENLKSKLEIVYPNLTIAGMVSPPFRELSIEEEEAYIQQIHESHTHILFVALGCPKQEKWMAKMKGRINATMLGVGGAFPMLAGVEKRAPIWMQKSMLEWVYRLIQDPKRLFKRYLITNSYFLYILFLTKFSFLIKRKTLE